MVVWWNLLIPFNVVQPIEVTNVSISIFEGQPVHLECFLDPILAQIRWTFNDSDIKEDNERISLQPDELRTSSVVHKRSHCSR